MVRRGSPAQVRLFGTAFKSALPQRKHSLWRRDVSPPTPECRLRPEEGNHHAEYQWPESHEGNAVAPAPRESADRASGEHAAAASGGIADHDSPHPERCSGGAAWRNALLAWMSPTDWARSPARVSQAAPGPSFFLTAVGTACGASTILLLK